MKSENYKMLSPYFFNQTKTQDFKMRENTILNDSFKKFKRTNFM